MRVKIDENMPRALKPTLRNLGIDADDVYDEGLQTRPDHEVLAAARQEGRFIITQDVGIADQRSADAHRGVMLVRLAEPRAIALVSGILWVFQNEPVESWTDAVVIVTDSKVRVRRAPSRGD